jgi:predicted DNA-binding ribbon-helix-helix protein
MSRGKIKYDEVISVRIASPTYMMLEEISREEKLKITELVREAVKEYIINKLGT